MAINLITQLSQFQDSAPADGFASAGEQILYTFQIQNTGPDALTGITFSNPNIVISPTFDGTLAVGATKTVTGLYTLQAADLDNGRVIITGLTARGTGATGNTITSNPNNDTEPLTVRASLAVDKTALRIENTNGNTLSGDAGDTIVYQIDVKNTSPRTAFNVTLQDFPGLATTGLPVTLTGLTDEPGDSDVGVANDLAIGGTATGLFNYVITQPDLDAIAQGTSITNRANARGVTKSGSNITGSSTIVIDLGPQPDFTIEKTAGNTKDAADAGEFIDANPNGVVDLGDRIKYTYKFTNTGNVTLTDIQGFDDQGIPGDGVDQTLTFTPGTLAPGQSATASYEAPVTQAFLDSGTLTNTVRATATPIGGAFPLDFKTDDETVTVNLPPAIDVTKVATPPVINNAKVGDPVQYNYTLKNTGPVSLLNVSLVDDNGTPGTGAAAADDVTINAIGTFKNGVQVAGLPGLTTGLSDLDNDGAADDLAVGATTTATFTGNLTQLAIETGSLTNIVVGQGTDRKGTTVTDNATAVVAVNGTPTIDVTKVANPILINNPIVGNGIQYSYQLKNTGTVNLLNVNLVDDNGTPGVGTAAADDVTINAIGTFRNGVQVAGSPGLTGGLTDLDNDGAADDLAVGATTTAIYQGGLTQKAIDDGSVTNIVVGKGTDSKGTTVTDNATAVVTINGNPAIDVTKAAQPNVLDNAKVGDPVQYNYTLKNTGSVSLLNVNLVDDNGTPGIGAAAADDVTINAIGTFRNGVQVAGLPGLTGGLTDLDNDGAADDLAVGATTLATYTGTLTQKAIDAGSVVNIVVGTGRDPKGNPVTDNATAVVTLNGNPAIDVTKVATPTAISNPQVGNPIQYSYTLKNTGAVSLLNVNLVDDNGTPGTGAAAVDDVTINAIGTFRNGIQIVGLPGLTGGLTDLDNDGAIDDLAVGATTTATYTGSLTQKGIDNGSVVNIVVGKGTDSKGTTVTDNATALVTVNATAAIDVTKVANPLAINNPKVGDPVQYSYTLKNTGLVNLLNVNLLDDNGTPGTGAAAVDDVTINAIGTFRNGVQIVGLPGLIGGLTDLDNDGALDDLAVGATTTATYTGSLTQKAIDDTSITNIVVGKGLDPKGNPVIDNATAIVQLTKPTKPPELKLIKTAGQIHNNDCDPNPSPGDTVTYTYEISNIGPVDVFNLVLKDDNGTPNILTDDFVITNIQGLETLDRVGTLNDLSVGKTAFGYYTKTLTAEDLCDCIFTNVGTVEGFSATGQKATASDAETIVFCPPSIDLVKCATLDLGCDRKLNVGDAVNYTFTITNNGRTALNQIVLDDPFLKQNNVTIAFAREFISLDAGESVNAYATYRLTEADLKAGFVHNVATVRANPSFDTKNDPSNDVSATAEASVQLPKWRNFFGCQPKPVDPCEPAPKHHGRRSHWEENRGKESWGGENRGGENRGSTRHHRWEKPSDCFDDRRTWSAGKEKCYQQPLC